MHKSYYEDCFFVGKGIVLGNLFTYEMFYIINRKLKVCTFLKIFSLSTSFTVVLPQNPKKSNKQNTYKSFKKTFC